MKKVIEKGISIGLFVLSVLLWVAAMYLLFKE